MKKLFNIDNLRTLLNVGGTAAVGVGVFLLPIDVSFRLIILGVMALIMWYTLQ